MPRYSVHLHRKRTLVSSEHQLGLIGMCIFMAFSIFHYNQNGSTKSTQHTTELCIYSRFTWATSFTYHRHIVSYKYLVTTDRHFLILSSRISLLITIPPESARIHTGTTDTRGRSLPSICPIEDPQKIIEMTQTNPLR
jgi:hypothetical protein